MKKVVLLSVALLTSSAIVQCAKRRGRRVRRGVAPVSVRQGQKPIRRASRVQKAGVSDVVQALMDAVKDSDSIAVTKHAPNVSQEELDRALILAAKSYPSIPTIQPLIEAGATVPKGFVEGIKKQDKPGAKYVVAELKRAIAGAPVGADEPLKRKVAGVRIAGKRYVRPRVRGKAVKSAVQARAKQAAAKKL